MRDADYRWWVKPAWFLMTLIVVMFSVSSTAGAYTFEFQVLAKGTGDPVEGATVVLLEPEEFQQSDAMGVVKFDVPVLPENVKVLAGGYETLTIPFQLRGDPWTKIYIIPVAFESEGLEVVAERIPEKISKFVLTADELSNSAGSQGDPIVAVNTLPGIVTSNEGRGQAYMRGSDLTDNLVFVDRVPIGYLYHLGDMRSTINPLLVSDLNIFLGGFPVDYGDRLGGVIDVKLRPAKQDRVYYNASISTIESSFLVEGPVSSDSTGGAKDTFFIAARRSYLDLLFSPAEFTELTEDDDAAEGESNRFITVPRYSDIQAKYRQQLDRGHMDYFYFMAADKIELENREGVKVDPQTAGETRAEFGFNTLGMSLQQQLADDWYIDMPVTLFESSTTYSFGTDDSGQPFIVDTQTISFTLNPKLDWLRSEMETFSTGIEASYFHAPIGLYISRPPLEQDGGQFYITDQKKYRLDQTLKARAFAPYIKQRKQWTDKITTEAGLRYVWLTATGNIKANATSPRVALEYQLTPDTLVTTSWGRYVQLPQGWQLLEGFGNPSLGFTESEHRIIGLEHKFNETWSSKAEIYHKPMKSLVVAIDGAAVDPPDNFKNEGEGDAYGLDLFIKRERSNGRMAWLSYSYSKSERTSKNASGTKTTRRFSGDQPHTLNVVWSEPFTAGLFDWMRSWKRWSWGLTFKAHSGNTYTPITGREERVAGDPTQGYRAITGDVNSERTPVYYRLDMRVAKEILRNESNIKIFFDIQNVTLHKNVVGYDYGDELENVNNPDEITGAGFFPFFGVEMEF